MGTFAYGDKETGLLQLLLVTLPTYPVASRGEKRKGNWICPAYAVAHH